jgi:hypothetical protein
MKQVRANAQDKQGKKKPKINKKLIGIIALCVLVLGVGITSTIVVFNKKSGDSSSIETGVDANTLTGEGQTLTVGKDGVKITSGGIYTLSDDITSGSVIISAGEADVQLILDSVSITNINGPAIFVESADNVYIELQGENTITSTATEDYNAAIYSKADLAFSGDGSLAIDSTIDGIVGKDDLQIDGGTYKITARDEGIVGKDSLKITGGNFAISAAGHGMKTSNEDEKGDMEITGGVFDITSGTDGLHSVANIVISGGDITISASDDGIHADSAVRISDGKVNVAKSYEGIEGGEIEVSGGDIKVVASDDGFNAAGGSDSGKATMDPFSGDSSKVLKISGGNIYVNASGDGLDSNGDIYISGGTTYVDGPTNNGNGAMDYGDGGCEFVISGGTLIAVGSSGMAVNATSASQPSVLMNLSGSYTGALNFGSISYTPSKAYNSVLISSPELSVGSSYTLNINGSDVQSVTISNNVTSTGTSGMMPGTGAGQQGGPGGGMRR